MIGRLPLSYAVRNLRRRPIQALLTVAGVAVVVFGAVLMTALSRGISLRLAASGDAANVLMISRKGQSAMFSSIEPTEAVHLENLEGLARNAGNAPIISPEILHVALVELTAAKRQAPLQMRGVQPMAWEAHPQARLSAGHLPEKPFEVVVGAQVHVRFGLPPEALALGAVLHFENRDWTVVGQQTAGGSLLESELWIAESDLMTVMRRRTHSLVVVRFTSPTAATTGLAQFNTTGPIERFFKGWRETDYYRDSLKSLAWIFWISRSMLIAVLIAGTMIGINTMHTAITRRQREFGTQRVLGFTRFDIAASVLVESVALCLLGGLVGVGIGYGLTGMPIVIGQGAFLLTVDTPVIATGLILAAVIGIIGALVPLVRVLRLPLVDALAKR